MGLFWVTTKILQFKRQEIFSLPLSPPGAPEVIALQPSKSNSVGVGALLDAKLTRCDYSSHLAAAHGLFPAARLPPPPIHPSPLEVVLGGGECRSDGRSPRQGGIPRGGNKCQKAGPERNLSARPQGAVSY